MTVYYVYKHIDPRNSEVVYVGMGQKSRAWDMGTKSGPKRSKEHFEWFSCLEQEGYTLDELVKVPYKRLVKGEALKMEKTLVKDHGPRFNKKQGRKPVLSDRDKVSVLSKRREGWSVPDLSLYYDVSVGTIWRVLTMDPNYKRMPKNQYTKDS